MLAESWESESKGGTWCIDLGGSRRRTVTTTPVYSVAIVAVSDNLSELGWGGPSLRHLLSNAGMATVLYITDLQKAC